MKRIFFATSVVSLLTIWFSFYSFAGQWITSGADWYYVTDDGNYAKNVWLWLDENHDNIAELYHFDATGVMSRGTTITLSDGGYDTLAVGIDRNGVASDYTHIYQSSTYYGNIGTVSFPLSYRVTTDSEEGYVYSMDIDHYDFRDIKDAWMNYEDFNRDNYSAKVYLLGYHGGSDPGVFGEFENCIKSTAKFAKNCKVKTYPDDTTYTSISNYFNNHKYFNYLIVDSVDSEGYITECSIMGVE